VVTLRLPRGDTIIAIRKRFLLMSDKKKTWHRCEKNLEGAAPRPPVLGVTIRRQREGTARGRVRPVHAGTGPDRWSRRLSGNGAMVNWVRFEKTLLGRPRKWHVSWDYRQDAVTKTDVGPALRCFGFVNLKVLSVYQPSRADGRDLPRRGEGEKNRAGSSKGKKKKNRT